MKGQRTWAATPDDDTDFAALAAWADSLTDADHERLEGEGERIVLRVRPGAKSYIWVPGDPGHYEEFVRPDGQPDQPDPTVLGGMRCAAVAAVVVLLAVLTVVCVAAWWLL